MADCSSVFNLHPLSTQNFQLPCIDHPFFLFKSQIYIFEYIVNKCLGIFLLFFTSIALAISSSKNSSGRSKPLAFHNNEAHFTHGNMCLSSHDQSNEFGTGKLQSSSRDIARHLHRQDTQSKKDEPEQNKGVCINKHTEYWSHLLSNILFIYTFLAHLLLHL